MTKRELKRLKKIADDLGVTLIPQINIWGHASAARGITGKHAALDFAPERQSLFEPWGGTIHNGSAQWNWCLSNPEAVRIIRELIEEMHDAFGNPPFFHIGCDEAYPPSCASCRAGNYSKLVADHISNICDLLKKRGARAMMWHDMLIKEGEARWGGFYANGFEATAKLPKMLPKSLVICDWFYGDAQEKYPTLDYFSKECGFDTLTCPWQNAGGIRAQMKYAADNSLFGVLATTWHRFAKKEYRMLFLRAANGAWGRGELIYLGSFPTVWRQCGWDAGNQKYSDCGWYENEINRDIGVD